MAQISFERYAELLDHPNTKKIRESMSEFDFYVTDEGEVRFYCMVEFLMRNPKYPMIDIVYGRKTYTEDVFEDCEELRRIAQDLTLRGRISAILFDKINSTCKILFSKLIRAMYVNS